MALREAQLVADQRDAKIVLRRTWATALKHGDLETGRSKLLGEDAAVQPMPTMRMSTGGNLVAMARAPLQDMSEMLTGSAVNLLPSLYFLMFSALLAMTPGKPIIFQPALSLLPP